MPTWADDGKRAVDEFVSAARQHPSALVIAGEAGIGKTTLWAAGIEDARSAGFRVLSARVGQAESVLAYAAVADLLSDVDVDDLAGLPGVQRLAVDRVLLRDSGFGPPTDARVIAAAVLNVLGSLGADRPVLIAVDDVQWLDTSSRSVLTFVARRLTGPVGVLVTERTESVSAPVTSWLQLSRTDGVAQATVNPMSLDRKSVV